MQVFFRVEFELELLLRRFFESPFNCRSSAAAFFASFEFGLNLFHSNNLLALKMVYVDTFKFKYSFILGAVMSRLSRVKTQNTKRNKNETNFNYFILFNINKKIISEIKIFIYTID